MKRVVLSVWVVLTACAAFAGYGTAPSISEAAPPVATSDVAFSSNTQVCPACIGGRCFVCSYGFGRTPSGATCRICRGTGRCFLCNGTWSISSGVRRPTVEYDDCYACRMHNGRCPLSRINDYDCKSSCVCKGTGYCLKCQGTGWMVKVNGRRL